MILSRSKNTKCANFCVAVLTAFIVSSPIGAKTLDVDVTDDNFSPNRIEITQGDTIIFHNSSRIIHSVHLTGRAQHFGRRHFVSDHLVYPDVSYSLTIGKDLKPGTYNLGCSLHSRMRGTLVVSASGQTPKGKREGERRKR